MKKRYYEKSLYVSVILLFLLLSAIVCGIIIRASAADSPNFSSALIGCAIPLAILMLIVMIASFARHATVFDNGISLIVCNEEKKTTARQMIYFDQIKSITETVYEERRPSIILTVLSILLLHDAAMGNDKYSVFTLYLKDGSALNVTIYGYSRKAQDEIINLLEQSTVDVQ